MCVHLVTCLDKFGERAGRCAAERNDRQNSELNIFDFKAVTTYIIVLVVIVLIVERVSTELRKRL
ncbi:MAG TPA: hypothetical protein VGG07_14080 [Solirubrobacteraceae bacterium]